MKIPGVESWSSVWDEVFSSQEWGKYPSEALVRFVARNFYKAVRKDVKILEVGCGPGANLWYLSREGFDAYGVDGSAVALAALRQRLEREHLEAQVSQGDIISLPYPDGQFDAVLDCECIYSNDAKNSRLIFQEIGRVLKPGGKFFSQTFSDRLDVGTGAVPGERPLEYREGSEGPMAGKGFFRLSTIESLQDLYKNLFDIQSIDLLEYTGGNRAYRVSEWIVVATKV